MCGATSPCVSVHTVVDSFGASWLVRSIDTLVDFCAFAEVIPARRKDPDKLILHRDSRATSRPSCPFSDVNVRLAASSGIHSLCSLNHHYLTLAPDVDLKAWRSHFKVKHIQHPGPPTFFSPSPKRVCKLSTELTQCLISDRQVCTCGQSTLPPEMLRPRS